MHITETEKHVESQRWMALAKDNPNCKATDTDGLRNLFVNEGSCRSYGTGQHILLQGEKSDFVVLLLEGCALLQRMLACGKRQIIDLVLPGNIIGFDTRSGFTLGLEAKTDCTVASISRAALRRNLLDNPHLCLQFAEAFALAECRAFERISQFGQLKARQRVACLIVEFALRLRSSAQASNSGISLPLTQIDIADMLGIAHETVCRVMAEMRSANLAAWSNSRIFIHDLDRLVACSGLDWDHHGYEERAGSQRKLYFLKAA